MNPNTTRKFNPPILIAFADDHRLVRESVTPKLEETGTIKVGVKAANGRELIDALEQCDQLPSVCLIDIMMPEMDGFQTVEFIIQRWPQMKILVLTSYLRESYIIKMIASGVNGYISKDNHPDAIIEAIEQVQEYDIYSNDLCSLKDLKSIREGKMELPQLTETEIQLLRYCIEDLTYLEIACKMHKTPKMIEGYRSSLCQKIGAKTRAGLALFAVRHGYVAVDTGVSPFR